MLLPDGTISDWSGSWIAVKRHISSFDPGGRDCFLSGVGRTGHGDLSGFGPKLHSFAV